MTSSTALRYSATLLLVGMLTGCTAGGEASSPLTSHTSAPSTSPVEGNTDGYGEPSEFEKQVAARNAPRGIPVTDGSTVTVTPGQPLPPSVIDKIAADAAPAVAQIQSGDEFETVEGRRNIDAVAKSYEERLSRTVVIVFRDHYDWWGALISDDAEADRTAFSGTPEKEGVVGPATEWANANDAYLVVVD